MAACRRTTEAPPRPWSRRGRISERPHAPAIDDSTAPIAAECQSFLDNVIAGWGRSEPWNHPNRGLGGGFSRARCQLEIGDRSIRRSIRIEREEGATAQLFIGAGVRPRTDANP